MSMFLKEAVTVEGNRPVRYSIIIPMYNEEARIRRVLENIVNEFKDEQIIVVDDGSSDRTVKIAESFRVSVIMHKENKGKGDAIKTGFLHAVGDIVGFVDADESVGPQDIRKVFDLCDKNSISIASRRHPNSLILIKPPLIRRIASRGFNALIRFLFGLEVKDTQCGCKAMGSEIVKSLIKELRTTGFEFDVELLWLSMKKGYEINEIPITWKHEEGSTFSLKNVPKMFVSLIKMRLR